MSISSRMSPNMSAVAQLQHELLPFDFFKCVENQVYDALAREFMIRF